MKAKNYISYDLPYPPVLKVLNHLENLLGRNLKNRGEAHVTVVTPPEFVNLSKVLPAEKIHALATSFFLTNPTVQWICLGQGSSNGQQTFFIVVTSPEFLKLRKQLALQAKITRQQFDPDLFFPHITLGFTEKDLHYDDGVIKDKSSCEPSLQPALSTEK